MIAGLAESVVHTPGTLCPKLLSPAACLPTGPALAGEQCVRLLALRMRVLITLTALALLAPMAAECQQNYRVDTPHPRLWLNARRLRLLKRERQRSSERWQELQSLIESGQTLPEEPLILALQYAVEDKQEAGGQAASWAVKRTGESSVADPVELRALAIVLDWCYPLFSEEDRAKILTRVSRAARSLLAQSGMQPFASLTLAAIASAGDWPDAERTLAALQKKWKAEILPNAGAGALDAPSARVAFLEACHALRDNLGIDLWDEAPEYFKQFPLYLMLQCYPAPFIVEGVRLHRSAEMDAENSDPALEGRRTRVGELLAVAYDGNSVHAQFLQGWVTHDSYRLRDPWGALYEFLWMNPYQVGLSYYSAPLQLYDAENGRLWARSSWDDEAAWVGYSGGRLQLFADGHTSIVQPSPKPSPILFPGFAVAAVSGDAAFEARLIEGEDVFAVGLQAGRTYWVKTGEQKRFVPQVAAKGGILRLHAEPGADTTFEIRSSDPNPPPPKRDSRR